MLVKWNFKMDEYEDSDDSEDYIEYDESKIPEVKLFHKFCQPFNKNPLPVGKLFESIAQPLNSCSLQRTHYYFTLSCMENNHVLSQLSL